MDNKKLLPQIRFKGFHDEWEEIKLGDYTDIITEKVKNNRYIFLSVTSGVGLVSQIEKFGKEIAGLSYKNYTVMHKFDFAYNKSATKDFPSGYIALLKEYSIAAVPSSIFLCFRINNKKINYYFLEQLFKYNYHHKYMQQFTSIGARAHGSLNIDSNDFFNMNLNISNINEQKKVGLFLTTFDTLISKKQIKLEKIKGLKQTLLKKMFPDENNDVPEIRFKGFTEKWEKKKFNYIFNFLKNNNFSRKLFIYNYGIVKNIHYGDILTIYDSYLDYNNKKIPYIKQDIKMVGDDFLVNGDVVFADTAEDKTAGKCIEIGNIKGKIIAGLHTLPCRANIKYAKYYLGYFFNSTYFHNQLVILMQGTKVSSLSKAAFLNTYIMYPLENEQEKIGKYFYKLDNLINLYEKEIEKLQKLKKAFFGKMFV